MLNRGVQIKYYQWEDVTRHRCIGPIYRPFTAAYQLYRTGYNFPRFLQLSIINARCQSKARKSIRMDVFLTAALVSLSHVHLRMKATSRYPAPQSRLEENIDMMWNHEPHKPLEIGSISDPPPPWWWPSLQLILYSPPNLPRIWGP